jgi:hypothetical protein
MGLVLGATDHEHPFRLDPLSEAEQVEHSDQNATRIRPENEGVGTFRMFLHTGDERGQVVHAQPA